MPVTSLPVHKECQPRKESAISPVNSRVKGFSKDAMHTR